MSTCAIIGAGLGGCALLAAMGRTGYAVRLHDRDDGRLAAVRERGGIDVKGLYEGFARAELVTPDLEPAVDGADLILVCTGSTHHAEVARSLAPLLRAGQAIVLVQGGTGGSLVARNELKRAGCRAEVDVGELDNYPFSLQWPTPTSMNFTIRKDSCKSPRCPPGAGPPCATGWRRCSRKRSSRRTPSTRG